MAQCAAVASAVEALPLLGGELQDAVQFVGKGVQLLTTGVLSGEPVALAAAAVVLVSLLAVYQITRFGASFIALFGFFLLVLCSV